MNVTAGTRLGPYEILAPLGAGGMGEVYRARDPRLRRDVAIKVIRAGFTHDSERLKRFEQEARAAGQLNHPNVLTIFDLGSYEGSPFVVSELLEGETLRQRLNARLPIRKALDYASQVAGGLSAAHEKGIVHRDLKPENLFVTRDGRVKILDFGLAKLVLPERAVTHDADTVTASLTEPGLLLGTAGYMAPEQVRGESADARADLFSLGCVLYEMLANRRAFQAPTTVETLSAILGSEPPPLSELRRDLPPTLDQIVHHCLEKEPSNRFQSAHDIAFALAALTSLSGTGASKVGVRPRMIWALVLLLVPAAIAIAYLAGDQPATQPSFQRLSFRRGFVASARFAPDGHTIVYGAAFDGRPVRLYSTRIESPESGPLDLPEASLLSISSLGKLAVLLHPRLLPPLANYRGTLAQGSLTGGAPREMLEDVTSADWSPDGTNLAVVHISEGKERLEFPASHAVYETSGWLSHPRVSADGTRVAFIEHPATSAEDRGNVMLFDRNGRVRALASGWSSIQGLSWSPNGKEVWFSAARLGNARDLWGVSSSGRLRLILRMAGGLTLHDISRDGRVLLARENFRDGILALLPGESQERDLSWFDWSDVSDLSADGNTLLFTELGEGAGPDYAVCLRRTDGSPVVRLGSGFATALSPDGTWAIAIVKTPTPHLVLLPTRAGQARALDPGPIRSIAWATWFPDGERIIIDASDGGPGRAYVQNVAGGAPHPLTPPGTVSQRVTPDGRYAVSDSLIPIDGTGPSVPLRGVEPGDLAIRFDSDGRKLFVWRFGELPTKIFRVDLASGRRELWRALMPVDASGVVGIGPVQITPDGRTYAYTYGRLLSDLYLVSGLE